MSGVPIEVLIDDRAKIVLSWWTNDKGKEYLSARMFKGNGKGQWFPQGKNGVTFSAEAWEALIPKIKEMLFYRSNPDGIYDEESAKGDQTPTPEESPGQDDF